MPIVVLGVTGCIGAYKACEVLRELQRREVDVHVVMTASATRFVSAMTFEALSRHPVFSDQFALGGDGDIRHISLADDADLLLVAPATANLIGKFARGIADDALSTLYTATRAPVLVAPAMNVNMFEHPAVVENIGTLRARGVGIVEPGSGYLACGWLGKGRLAEVPDIVDAAMRVLQPRRDLDGRSVLVSAGPTIEDIDPVRYISNRSSGRMGYAIAAAAQSRGADVTLVSGPVELPAPSGRQSRRRALRQRDGVGGQAARGERGRRRHGRRGRRLPARQDRAPEVQEGGRLADARARADRGHSRGSRCTSRPHPRGLRRRDREAARARASQARDEAARPDRGERCPRGETRASAATTTRPC